MKTVVVLGLLAVVGMAQASFDLVLVLDRSTRAIHRYDGNTGTYLGKIDTPVNGTLRSMTLDQENQRVFVADSIGVHAYNYNTGAQLFSNLASNAASGVTWVGGATGLLRGSTFSNALFRMVTPSGTSSWGSIAPSLPASGNWVGVAADTTGDFLALSSTGSLTRLGEQTVELGASTYGQVSVRGTQFIMTRANTSEVITGSTQNLPALTSTTVPGMTLMTAGTFGHDNIQYYVGKNPVNSSQGMVYRVATNSSGLPVSIAAQFGTSQLVDPAAVAVVLAPEPGTMIALGAGVLALLRRRVRK